MLAVTARAYITSICGSEAWSSSLWAIADQRRAEKTLLRIATPTAAAKSHGFTPESERASVRGSTYQRTRTSSAAPATTRSATFTFDRAARRAGGLAARDRCG